jgi:hypothetical protein
MDENLTEDELLADLIADVALDVQSRFGSARDPDARYVYFREFVDLSPRTVEARSRNVANDVVIQ